jgi:peroxiredoxin
VPSLKGWADFLGGVPFPLLSDFWPHGAVGKAFGIFNEERGIDKRAAYVIDAKGIIPHQCLPRQLEQYALVGGLGRRHVQVPCR